jgi:hypothetical protein
VSDLRANRLKRTYRLITKRITMTCLNCSTPFDGNYCNECGQKTIDTRFTLKSMGTDLFFSAFHVEKKGLPVTIKNLALTPGASIRDFLHGKRQSLYPPFKYLVLMGAIVIVFSLRYRFFHNEFTQVESNSMNKFPSWLIIPDEYKAYIESFFRFAEDQATLLNIAAIPVFAFFSWALLSKSKYNFAENLILNTFITAQQLFYLLLLVPFFEFFPMDRDIPIAVYTAGILIYNIWVYVQFFEDRKLMMLLKSGAIVVVAYVYQFPVNFMIFQMYDNYIHHHMHWIPQVYDHILQ